MLCKQWRKEYMLGNMLSNLNQNMKVAFNICLLYETCILLLLLLLLLSPSILVLPGAGVLAMSPKDCMQLQIFCQ